MFIFVADIVHDVQPARLVAVDSVLTPVCERATLATFVHLGLEELDLRLEMSNIFLMQTVSKLVRPSLVP